MNAASPPAGRPFTKMHGIGNDFAIFDGRGGAPRLSVALARAVADRHTGAGCDQVVEILPSERGDLRLVFFNADGSPSGACGNATRCVAAREMAARGTDTLVIETAAGLLPAARMPGGRVRVNMGPPQLDWAAIPLAHSADTSALPLPDRPAAVGMGNPHCVHFVADMAEIDLAQVGPAIEHDPLFPERTNVEFAELRVDGTLRLRVWERGAGITLACGSGACAAAVAAHRRGLTGPALEVELDGGWLSVDWREDGVWLAGPTAHVYDATLAPAFLEAHA